MTAVVPSRLEAAVASLCPEIEARVTSAPKAINERQLWWELSCCLLSSQIPFPLALAAADAVQDSTLLADHNHSAAEMIEGLTQVLEKPFRIGRTVRSYRFPKVRARQLAATRAAVTNSGGSLEALIGTFNDPHKARQWFVTTAPGLGPKQTSMFLRNSGISYDLAVLDRHVLRYMAALGISEVSARNIGSLGQYRRHEKGLREYAQKLGYSVGMLDWAIWIVMRMVGKRQLELAIE